MSTLRENIFKLFIAFSILNAADPAPPIIPEVQAVKNHKNITLIWDDKSENSIDPLTGYSDFEGYRIYRSTDGGITWGTSQDKIFDFLGNHVAWKPYAQFDLTERGDTLHCNYKNGYFGENYEKCYTPGYVYDTVSAADLDEEGVIIDDDSLVYLPKSRRGLVISGYDPLANWVNLGENTGLTRSFVDSTVLDGVEYTYAVTAYDMGMKSFEVNYISQDSSIPAKENDYCIGDDSYCDGTDFCCENSETIEVLCDGKEFFCDCTNGTSGCSDILNTKDTCEGASSNGVWTIIEYATEQSCELDIHGFSLKGGGGFDNVTGFYAGIGIDGCAGAAELGIGCDNEIYAEECPVSCGYTITGCGTLLELELDGTTTGLSSTLFTGPGGEEIQLEYITDDVLDPCALVDNSIHVTNTGIVQYKTDTPILSFQFNVDGANIVSASGGASEEAGFKVFVSDYDWKEVIYSDDVRCEAENHDWIEVEYVDEESCEAFHGFSIGDPTIVGCGSMIELKLDGDATGLSNISIFDAASKEIPTTYFQDDAIWDGDACRMPNYSIHITSSGTVLYNFPSYCSDSIGDNIYIDKSECTGDDSTWIDIEIAGFKFNVDGAEVDSVLIINNVVADSADFITSWDYNWEIVYFSSDTVWSRNNPGHFRGLDYSSDYKKLWGYPSFESSRLHESFTDYNSNGKWDVGEPFTDCGVDDLGDPICEDDENWDVTFGNGIWDKRINPINVVTLQPGYKSSNITFPADTPDIEFIIADSGNVGNGQRFYNIVNEYDLTDAILRFEINAGSNPDAYGDATGSFPTLNPGLFCYEAKSIDNFEPMHTYDVPLEDIDADSLEIIREWPGVKITDDSEFMRIPNYKIEDLRLLGVDHPLSAANYSDWFDGIQFRFDNGPNGFTNPNQIVKLKALTFSDSLLEDYINIKMKYIYKDDLTKRLMYNYKIEFSDSILDTVIQTSHPSSCTGPVLTELPFKVTNIATGNAVKLRHTDRGIEYGLIHFGDESALPECADCNAPGLQCINGDCKESRGFSDCIWQQNEPLQIVDTVYTSNNLDGKGDEVFFLQLGFDQTDYILSYIREYFQLLTSTGINWNQQISYALSDIVLYDGMLYQVKDADDDGIAVADSIPSKWYDLNGDNINDNPWKMLYPWKDGDSVIIEPYGWYQDGDAWVANLTEIGSLDENSADDLQDISVVPNPYIVNANYFNESPGNHLLRFTRLPNKCDISIYTVSGEFVTSISHHDPFDGNAWWDLKNGHNQEVAPGLYIYVVVTPSGNKKIGKFAIVR